MALNTTLNTKAGYILHGPQGDCVSLEQSGQMVDYKPDAIIGFGVELGEYVKDVNSMQSTYQLAKTGEFVIGFVGYEISPNIFGSPIFCLKLGMRFVGKTAVDSGIVAGDLITVVDGAFKKGVAGDYVIGHAFEDGINSANNTYGTVTIFSFAQSRLMN